MNPQQITPDEAPFNGTAEAEITAEALIEEVSIDGMCGVY